MGRWAESEFGAAALPHRAYLFAGLSVREKVDAVIGGFGNIRFHRHDVYERYLVEGADGGAVVMFQLYGAPIMCDLVAVLKDGGVTEAVFFGYAYGIGEGMQVGDCVLPNRVQALDGVTTRLDGEQYAHPNAEMTDMIAEALQQHDIPFQSGVSVSVPATFWHGDESKIDSDAIALELEFAAFCHCASVAGVKAGGVLVISDTSEQGLLDDRPPRDPAMLAAFRAVKTHLESI